jgi:hypothetical protein
MSQISLMNHSRINDMAHLHAVIDSVTGRMDVNSDSLSQMDTMQLSIAFFREKDPIARNQIRQEMSRRNCEDMMQLES